MRKILFTFSLLCALLCVNIGAWASTATLSGFTNSTPAASSGPVTVDKGGLTISSNNLYASGSNKTFTIDAGTGNTISFIELTMSGTSNRYTSGNITNCTSCTRSSSVYSITISPATQTVSLKNNGGAVTITQLVVTYSSSCTSITPSLSYASVGGTTLAIGGSSSGSPTVTGNTGSGAVTYSITASSPSGCATVNPSTGVVTGVHAGTATVTASIAAASTFCSGTATANFTISCNSITPTFSTDYTSTTLTVGGGNSSTPVVDKDGSSGAITWTSSAPAKATVNTSGVVTPVAAGSATITATIAEDGDYCEGSVSKNFTINAAACSPSISASPSSANYCKDDVATALTFTGSGHNAQKWQYYDGDSWEDIDGATNATYTPSTSATGSTQYRVVTTCDSYTTTATSSAATVTVKTSPNLTISLAP